MKTSKCQIVRSEVKYLGHVLGFRGLRMDRAGVTPVADIKAPADKTQLLAFMGLVNYYRRFLPSLSEVEAPLREIVKSHKFEWNEKAESACKQVKNLISREFVLSIPDVRKQFIVDTDASDLDLEQCSVNLMIRAKNVQSRSLLAV